MIMKRRYSKQVMILLLIFISSLSVSQAQSSSRKNYWDVLSRVKFEVQQDEYGELYVPAFSKEIEELEGREIVLQGFIIPFEGMFKPKRIILSSLPVDACFFCGTGGPETVAEVYLKEEIKYTARPVRIRGKLKINKDSIEELMYVLENAVFAGYADEK